MNTNEIREEQIQRQFLALKKCPQQSMAEGIAALFEQHEAYSKAVISCTATYLRGNVEEKRVSLFILAVVRWRGTARTTLVKEFLEPVLRLFQSNTEEALIVPLEQALSSLFSLGGNCDQKKIMNSLKASLNILANKASKEIRKICAYCVLKIIVNASPYLSFKWLDEKTEGDVHLTKVVDAGCSRNGKLRLAYVFFLEEYLKYTAQKKDSSFQKQIFRRLFDLSHSQREANEEAILLCLETTCVLLKYLSHEFGSKYVGKVLEFTLEQLRINKSISIFTQVFDFYNTGGALQKALIELLPRVAQLPISSDSMIRFIRYLLSVKGEDELAAHRALGEVIESIASPSAEYSDVMSEVLLFFTAKIQKIKPQFLIKSLSTIVVNFNRQLLKIVKEEAFSGLISMILLLSQGSETLQLLECIRRFDCFNLSRCLQIKLVLLITKILTGGTNRILHETKQIESFVQSVDKNKKIDSELNKVHAIHALSKFAFSRQFKGTIYSLIRERVLKQYLLYGSDAIRAVAVEAAFALRPLNYLDQLLRIGMTDKVMAVKEKVFQLLYEYLITQELENLKEGSDKALQWDDRAISHLMQAVRSQSAEIRTYSLKILCVLQQKGISSLINSFLKKILYRCLYHIRTYFQLMEQKTALVMALAIFVEYGTGLVEAHTGSILTSLLAYIKTDHYQLTATLEFDESLLYLIRSFAQQLPSALLPYLKELCTFVLTGMDDKLNFKFRAAALHTFAVMVLRCGYTGIPYSELPALRNTLSYLTRSELQVEEKDDLMRIIGGLGIVIQSRIKVQSYYLHRRREVQKSNSTQYLLQEQLLAFSRELRFFQSTPVPTSQPLAIKKKEKEKQQLKVNKRKMTDNTSVTVVRCLLQMLEDDSLQQKHALCLQVLKKALRCTPFECAGSVFPLLVECLGRNVEILPCILTLAEVSELTPFLNELLPLILSLANKSMLVEALEVLAVRSSLRVWLGVIVNTLYGIIEDYDTDKGLMLRILAIYRHLKVDMYADSIVPQLISKFVRVGCEVGGSVLELIKGIARRSTTILQFLPLLVPAITELLSGCDTRHSTCKPCLREKAATCVVTLVILYRTTMATYLPTIHEAFLSLAETPSIYVKMVRHLEEMAPKTIDEFFNEEEILRLASDVGDYSVNSQRSKSYARVDDVLRHFDTKDGWQEEDWQHWLQHIALMLLRTSPESVLEACSDLAQDYPQLALQLLNTSFVSHWQKLPQEQRQSLLRKIMAVLRDSAVVPVRKAVLQLLECVARHAGRLQSVHEAFGPHADTLASTALALSAPAAELYFRELYFEYSAHKADQFDSLIGVYMKMGEKESAKGVIHLAASHRLPCPTAWYYQIGDYHKAYHLSTDDPTRKNKFLLLKSLSHLNDSEYIAQYKQKTTLDPTSMEELRLLAVQAYSNLQQWDGIQAIVPSLEESEDKSLWEAILAVRQNKDASLFLSKARQILYKKSLLSTDSVRMQKICELEEICRKTDSLEVWEDRMRGFPEQSELWERIRSVRQLSSHRLFDFDYRYCEICLKEGRIEKCKQRIELLRRDLEPNEEKMVRVLESKVVLAEGEWNRAKVEGVLHVLKAAEKQCFECQAYMQRNGRRIGKMYFQCAQWLRENVEEYPVFDQLALYEKAAKVGHSRQMWGMLSAMQLQVSKTVETPQQKAQLVRNSLLTIVLSLERNEPEKDGLLQDYLKILALLHDEYANVCDTFKEHYRRIPIEGWIDAVPQIVAQLHEHPSDPNHPFHHTHTKDQSGFIDILKELCEYIGRERPQQILFALNVSICSGVRERAQPARDVFQKIRKVHPVLVEEAELAARQLGWAAVKLKELWYQVIEAAWLAWTQNNKQHAVFLLHELGEETTSRSAAGSQYSFYQQHQLTMKQGFHWLREYERSHNEVCMSQAFALLLQIAKQSQEPGEKNRKMVYLREVAPGLLRTWRELCVPGEQVRISRIINELRILPSKQRPRKLSIEGEDGKTYNFLLKGREDLRLDERVMQFLGLMNRLLQDAYSVIKKDLSILRYPIIPLTRNTGLIGWVEESDTITELIREHRANRNIRHYVEKEYYEKTAASFLSLLPIHKLEIFRAGQEVSQGRDLQDILWLKATNSEEWLEHRNSFTTSLATMSMVGYILGLGDRHLSNILWHRPSGKVLHIDFGDCFEVAMLREKYPERVPFRLTRLLQKAMGTPSIHGLFKRTCCVVMHTLRKHKETLFGVLETFVHDPILTWQATQGKKNDSQNGLLNEKAEYALSRVKRKLRGNEGKSVLSVEEQVKKLIEEATSHYNICQSWLGWCPFW